MTCHRCGSSRIVTLTLLDGAAERLCVTCRREVVGAWVVRMWRMG